MRLNERLKLCLPQNIFFRINNLLNSKKFGHHTINLNYVNAIDSSHLNNLGDAINPVIYNWMLQRKGIDPNKKTSRTRIFHGIGSILGFYHYDATVWGSGVHDLWSIENCMKWRDFRRLDIRALRGPQTLSVMRYCKYVDKTNLDDIVLGDPAVLLPLIYVPESDKKALGGGVVLHLYDKKNKYAHLDGKIKFINIGTRDYKSFVNQLVCCDKIISSSLHGIILAEAYGIPAIFLMTRSVEDQILKYLDWYWSTGRYSVKIARTIEEALAMEPMELPDLKKMREDLLNSFPYDIF